MSGKVETTSQDQTNREPQSPEIAFVPVGDTFDVQPVNPKDKEFCPQGTEFFPQAS